MLKRRFTLTALSSVRGESLHDSALVLLSSISDCFINNNPPVHVHV